LLIWKKSTKEELVITLPALIKFLEVLDMAEWNKQALEEKIKAWIAEQGFSVGSVMWPMRVALSGQENSPGPFEIAEALGKKEVLVRLLLASSKLVS
jgi:glutamyl-tRNA synthetase